MHTQEILDALLLAVNEAEQWLDDGHGYSGRLDALGSCYRILDAHGMTTNLEKRALIHAVAGDKAQAGTDNAMGASNDVMRRMMEVELKTKSISEIYGQQKKGAADVIFRRW